MRSVVRSPASGRYSPGATADTTKAVGRGTDVKLRRSTTVGVSATKDGAEPTKASPDKAVNRKAP